MSEFSCLLRDRIRSKITQLGETVASDTLSQRDRTLALANLETWRTKIEELNDEIGKQLCAENQIDEVEWENREAFEFKIAELTLTLREQSQAELDLSESINMASSTQIPALRTPKMKLPEIPLPTFSNSSNQTLNHFLDNFNAVIDKYNLSQYEKFVYLKKQLSGEPLTLISSLSGDDQTFTKAVSLLREAFADVLNQQYAVIKRLSELTKIDTTDPYVFIGEVRLIQDLFVSLGLTVDLVLQYFIWSALSGPIQNQLINMGKENRPNLKFINANIFRALDRVRELEAIARPAAKRPENLSNNCFAVDVKTISRSTDKSSTGKFCSLCKGHEGHLTKDCPKYKEPTDKVNRLKSVGGCTKCGFLNHATANCKYEFRKRCFKCTGNHMSFLCMSRSNANQSNQNPTKVKKTPPVQTGVVWTGPVNTGEETILPTFIAKVHNEQLRVLKDTGCQPHFILQDLADNLQLEVVCKKEITINGFNSGQKYNSNVVKVPMTISDDIHYLNAICIPSIKTNMHIPRLTEICNALTSRGYALADPGLSRSNRINGIQFILGMSDPQVLPEAHQVFGKTEKIVLSKTPAGVMLMGDAQHVRRHLHLVPELKTPEKIHEAASSRTEVAEDSVSEVSINHIVIEESDINLKTLHRAAENLLDREYEKSLGYSVEPDEPATRTDANIIEQVLEDTHRLEDGRLSMPLTWRKDVSHCLGGNFGISQAILKSLRKLPKDQLAAMDQGIREWYDAGIIGKVSLPEVWKTKESHSFLPHMAVFRPDRETTKCRIVFLSNVCEKKGKKISLSHNQAIHPGPNLNQKITTALTHLRFDEHLLCSDLKKAFLQIALRPEDSDRLMFLWFKDVHRNDFSIVAYKNLRLTFGLRCSPTILMLALYKILCLDTCDDPEDLKERKRRLYSLIYMDNGAYTGTASQIAKVHGELDQIYGPYRFETQQLTTSDAKLQEKIDKDEPESTPDKVKLLGISWNRELDSFSARKIELDSQAKTKRCVLRTISSQYDPLNFQGPCMNRARLFMHGLQQNPELGWDKQLTKEKLREWRNITAQANKMTPLEIPRSMGEREDSYSLITFTDASKSIYAAVTYLRNNRSKQVSFLGGKNRLVNKTLALKTIPALELQAISLGVESIADFMEELAGPKCLYKIDISERILYTDSSIAIHWLTSQSVTLDKMQKKSVFVRNRLDSIERACKIFPTTFSFVGTHENPADFLTRCISPSLLSKSCYLTGPEFLREDCETPELTISIPYIPENVNVHAVTIPDPTEPVFQLERFSRLSRALGAMTSVMIFISKLKRKINLIPQEDSVQECRTKAWEVIVRESQQRHYSSVFDALQKSPARRGELPDVCTRLNLGKDEKGLLRVRSKFNRFANDHKFQFPLLLHHNDYLTSLLISETHLKFCHAGIYTVVSELKKRFWIIKLFSTVRVFLRKCVICRRINFKTIKINQNSYRDFRANPKPSPFADIFIDYLGPFHITLGTTKPKVWLLLITCLWSRAITLLPCYDMSLATFLKSLQQHIFREGTPSLILSDSGNQLRFGSRAIMEHLKKEEMQQFLSENGIENFHFEVYVPGNSALGSLVESCVKLVKRLLFGAIRNDVLNHADFHFAVEQVISVVNKRPISFLEALRDNESESMPNIITPELLVKGRELAAINIVPTLEPPTSQSQQFYALHNMSYRKLWEQFAQIRELRLGVTTSYIEQFQSSLWDQATAKKGRYIPLRHFALQVGDVVLIKEPHFKFNRFPMAKVTKINVNNLGEVTDVQLDRGRGCTSSRHVTSLVPLLRPSGDVC